MADTMTPRRTNLADPTADRASDPIPAGDDTVMPSNDSTLETRI